MSIVSEYPAAGSYGSNNGDAAGYVLARSFRYWRARGLAALPALERARGDTVARYPVSGDAINPRNDKREAWVERPADVGLRFVGWSDEIAGRAVSHRGWYLNDDGDGDVARGCVYQLPGRKGEARFVAAYRTGGDGRNGWQDMSGDDSALVSFAEIFHGPTRGESDPTDYESAIDAALRADRVAEIMAKAERDYQAAWRKGNEAREAIDDGRTRRANAARVLAEVRGLALAGLPETCAMLRRSVAEQLASARECYETAKSLFDQYGDLEPFREGAGASDYWSARK